MAKLIVNFADVLVLALVVGAMFGIWLGYSPSTFSASTYIEQQQHSIRSLNTKMPSFGAIGILLTVGSVMLASNPWSIALLGIAIACFVTTAAITRLINQPINRVVMQWNAQFPPVNWQEFRDQWWHWHTIRTASGVVGLSLVILAILVEHGSL